MGNALYTFFLALLQRLPRGEAGSTAVEYSLILMLISIVTIGSMIAAGASVEAYFTQAELALQ